MIRQVGRGHCFGWLSLSISALGNGYLKSGDGTGRAQKPRAGGWVVGRPPVNLQVLSQVLAGIFQLVFIQNHIK